jgi:broad specificity phosphatase PhoE
LIVLARHGESEYSARGLLNGDINVPVALTELGIRQASELGEALKQNELDLCVTSEFQRARETADLALDGRDVPRVVLPELNDPLYGPYEGAQLEDFRVWASAQPSSAVPEGGESRLAIVERYARAFRVLAARPEKSILVVSHSLPVAYALAAREGRAPEARVPLAAHATPYPFTREELDAAAALLEEWAAKPTW